ncbi:MAG: ThuA domain-containing protein [Planctomycetaceae bacterium]|nr:ThuA domain-containing protein [Planctomycetaceae bacterium]
MAAVRAVYCLCSALLVAAVAASLAQGADPPVPPARSAVLQVLAQARGVQPTDRPLRPLTIVLLADKKDHGPGEHDYPRWQSRWALLLGGAAASTEQAANLTGADLPDPSLADGAPQVRVVTVQSWPSSEQWASADLVVAFCYLAWNEQRIAEARQFLKRGGGLVLIHSATWTMPEPSLDIAGLVGVGGFVKYRHGPIDLTIRQPDHPICAGLPPTIALVDESYFPPTPALDTQRVQVLATCQEEPNEGEAGPSSQPMYWTYEPDNEPGNEPKKGRVFGCVLGHNNFTFDHPYFRLLLLRGMAWAAHEEPSRFDALTLRSASVTDD